MLSEKAYAQEQEREKAIKEKLDYLFKWVTLFITVINVALTVMMKQSVVDFQQKVFVYTYEVLMGALICAMIAIVLLQLPRKRKVYPFGTDVLRAIKKYPERFDFFNDEKSQIYKEILYRDTITNQLRKSNDVSIYGIVFTDIMLIIAVVALAVFLGRIMTGS